MLEALFDAVWPRRCEACGGAAARRGRHVCGDCLMRLPFVRQGSCCPRCGREFPGIGGGSPGECQDCAGHFAPAFDAAVSALRFEGEARRMILDFKFNRRLWLRDDFTDWLEAALVSRFPVVEIDAIVPMPATVFNRLDRGYSQCAILGGALARRIDRRCLRGAVRRKGSPSRQAGLSAEERRENAKDSFAVIRPEMLRGRTLLVLDDVMTTGATLSECARALKAAGAWRVWCLALAQSVMS